uniref:ABC transporter substrate-binding protein n=1 Tax=Fervidicoccus fontis TaxID=683846 RepID=A0A7J3ZLF6_9CREN
MRAQTKNLIIAAVIALVIGVAIGYVVKPSAPGPTTTVPETATGGAQFPEVIKIGALLPLTGDLASFGENDAVAIKVAEEDANRFLQEVGLPYRVEVVIEDTETKADVALQKLQSLYARGIRLIVGPMSSAELRNIKGYADSNKIVIVSQSSTAPALAIPGDYVFRLVTDDTFQGKVIAGLAKHVGIEHAVIMWRGDAWGDGLAEATKNSLQILGINVYDGPRYAPEAKEFSAEVSQLASMVQDLVNRYGPGKVGVVLICFEEVVPIMIQASQYPVLSQVRWFGSDGIANSAALAADPVASQFAINTQVWAPIAAPAENPKTEHVKSRVYEKLGREPESYAYNSYDAVWLLVLSVIVTGKYDGEAVKNALPAIAENFFGASGWTKLNEAGDRAFADYYVWTVVEEKGRAVWKLVGIYDTITNAFRPAS